MKILSEVEQLKRRKDELYESSQFLQNEINEKETLMRRYEDSWRSTKRAKGRVIKYEVSEYKKIRQIITDYYNIISDRYDSLQEPKNSLP